MVTLLEGASNRTGKDFRTTQATDLQIAQQPLKAPAEFGRERLPRRNRLPLLTRSSVPGKSDKSAYPGWLQEQRKSGSNLRIPSNAQADPLDPVAPKPSTVR